MRNISRKVLVFIISLSLCFSFIIVNSSFATTIKITSIENIYKNVFQGDSYKLPSSVSAKISNKAVENVSIKWTPTTVTTKTLGLYKFNGTVKGYAKKVILYLKVIIKNASI